MFHNTGMPARKLKVLVVEDDGAVAALVRRALEASGHSVSHAPSAEDGLAALKAGAFDLVLLDNGLPGAMGIKALPDFVALGKAPVVMMTGHVNEDVEKDAVLLGAKALLPKPFEASRLEEFIFKVVEGK